MKIEIVKNINQYLNIIHRTEYFKKIWYRGHKKASYRLEPTLYRNKKKIVTGDDSIQFRHYELIDEELTIKEFKKVVKHKFKDTKLSDIDYLYLMQHNGIETRLLDFTRNPLVALFFSVVESKEENNEPLPFDEDDEFNESASAVFCINPLLINKYSFGAGKIIDLSYVKFNQVKTLFTPICIEPSNYKIDKRLEIQDGKFVFFGKEIEPLDWYDIFRESILKIIIPDTKRNSILSNLDKKFNINYTTIYPDMEGVKLHVKQKSKGKFKNL